MVSSRAGRAGVLLLVVISFVYLVIPPADERPLHRAFSPMVQLLTYHDSPGRRIQELVDTPVAEVILKAADEEMEWETIAWMRELMPGEVMFGKEPFLGENQTPGWVGVSRVGARHLRHRILLDGIGLRRYELHGRHHGRTIWTRQKKGRQRITLAVASGIVVACIHDDPDAIRDVLDRLDGLRPPVPQSAVGWLLEGKTPDRMLLREHGIPYTGPLMVEFLPPEPDALTFRVTGHMPIPSNRDMHLWAARFGGPATLAMARLPALPEYELQLESVALLTGSPFQGAAALFGIPALHIVQPRDTSFEPDSRREERVAGVLERQTHSAWTPEPIQNGFRLRPGDSRIRRFLRGAHVPGILITEEVVIYTTSLLSAENLIRRAERPAETEFELRDVAWRDPAILAWVGGASLAAELQFLAQIAGFFQDGDNGKLPDFERILEGVSQLRLRVDEINNHQIRIRVETL